jgi:short-subunit dehydrogenase
MVTGATSGVGEALSRQLSQRGASVLVHGRDAARVREVSAGLLAAGGNAQAFVADLGSLSQVRRLANSVNAAGPLDVLVNNAVSASGAILASAKPALTASSCASLSTIWHPFCSRSYSLRGTR